MIPLHKLERTILEYLNKHDNRDLNEIAKNTNILIDCLNINLMSKKKDLIASGREFKPSGIRFKQYSMKLV